MAASTELISQVLDEKYRIDKQLGEGGMGAVYLATHLGTRRPVALKVIAPQFMANTEFVERFKREAEAAGRLRHPNVVNVTDFGFARVGQEQLAYLVMEYLDGCSLGAVLREEGRLPLGWVVDILEQACSAIEEAHQQGIIHRDLKPDNIWLEPNGRVGYTIKVLDFGLAKLRDPAPSNLAGAEAATDAPTSPELFPPEEGFEALSQVTSIQNQVVDPEAPTQIQSVAVIDPEKIAIERDPNTSEGLTRVGSVLGTPLYMSPEQCRGETLDARSDIYSLGVIAYQMLSGQTPFTGDTYQLIVKHSEVSPPPLKEKQRNISKSVAALVMSALAKNPADRPATAAAFASALRARAEGAGTLLRKAIGLYSEHFPTFIVISLLGHIPWIVARLVDSIGPNLPSPIFVICFLLFFFLSILFANAVNAGVFVPVVAQLMVAPLRPVRIRPAFAALKKRLGAFATTSILFYVIVLLVPTFLFGPIFFITSIISRPFQPFSLPFMTILGQPVFISADKFLFPFMAILVIRNYINNSLYAPVVMIEGQRGRMALARSKALVSRSRLAVIKISLLYVILYFLPRVLALAGSYMYAGTLLHTIQIVGNTAETIQDLLKIAFSILFNPPIAIAFALLYLKTRQAGGETLKEALGQFEEETPRSKWQSRMH